MKKRIVHPFEPIYDEKSKVLILGSMPSVKTREMGFPYAHPQNRFWKVMGIVFGEEIKDNKKEFLLKHNIALWDAIESCEIVGSSDATIKNIQPNYRIQEIIQNSQIKKVFTTGSKAFEVYNKYIFPITKVASVKLPSTSPANASWTLERLVSEYSQIKEILD